MAEFDGDYSIDDGLDDGEHEEQPEPQPATVIEPVAPAPPAAPTESVESIRSKIDAIHANEKLSGEKKGEALLPLYKRLIEAEKAVPAPKSDPVADSREVESSLRNTLGNDFDSKIRGIGQIGVDLYGREHAAEKITEFAKNLEMPVAEQIAAHQRLADAASEGPGDLPLEETTARTGERLLELWGDRADEEHEFEQKAAALLGGTDKIDALIKRKWPGNPMGRVKFRLALARMGRRIKSQN